MIQLTNLSKSFGGQTLFNDINLKLSHGQKIGLVGRNGSGKSTLFKIILGEEGYDSGDLSIPKNYRVGSLKQHLFLGLIVNIFHFDLTEKGPYRFEFLSDIFLAN